MILGQNYQQPPQQNGIPHQPNYQMPPNMQQQMTQMMGNLSLQSPPQPMPNMHPMGQPQPQGPGMQITQPMTYNLQADSNQNIPVYQQR